MVNRVNHRIVTPIKRLLTVNNLGVVRVCQFLFNFLLTRWIGLSSLALDLVLWWELLTCNLTLKVGLWLGLVVYFPVRE